MSFVLNEGVPRKIRWDYPNILEMRDGNLESVGRPSAGLCGVPRNSPRNGAMFVMRTDLNRAYTLGDHAMREFDRYALAKYSMTLRWLGDRLRPGVILYNIGLGSGYFNHLAVRTGASVIGCEPDATVFASAQQSKPVRNCELVLADLASFSRNHPPADVIVMHDVLEHIEDDSEAVRNLAILTRKGGSLVLSVPALPQLFGQHDVELGHFRRYTKSSLRSVLEPHFRIRRLRYFGMASIPIVLYFSVISRQSYPKVAAADNLVSRAYGFVCMLESNIVEPIGTSLIAEIEPI